MADLAALMKSKEHERELIDLLISGDFEDIKEIVESHLGLYYRYGPSSLTLAHCAVAFHRLDVLTWLYNCDSTLIKVPDIEGGTPFHWISADGDGKRKMAPWFAQVGDNEGRIPPLHSVHSASADGQQVDDNEGRTPLHSASADCQQVDDNRVFHTPKPLKMASADGQLEQWLDYDITSIQAGDNEGDKPLHSASTDGQLEKIGWLCGIRGGTPLHFASARGQLEMAQLLHKCDLTLIKVGDKIGRTPLHWASEHGQLEMAQWLCECDATLIRVRDKLGWTPLHYASARGQLEMAQLLHKCDPTLIKVTDNDGRTPLHWASAKGRLKIGKWLHECDSKLIKVSDRDGWIPLHYAIKSGELEMAQCLHRCDPTLLKVGDNMGRTPLHWATTVPRLDMDMVQWLYECDPTLIKVADNEGHTPLYSAPAPVHRSIMIMEQLPNTVPCAVNSVPGNYQTPANVTSTPIQDTFDAKQMGIGDDEEKMKSCGRKRSAADNTEVSQSSSNSVFAHIRKRRKDPRILKRSQDPADRTESSPSAQILKRNTDTADRTESSPSKPFGKQCLEHIANIQNWPKTVKTSFMKRINYEKTEPDFSSNHGNVISFQAGLIMAISKLNLFCSEGELLPILQEIVDEIHVCNTSDFSREVTFNQADEYRYRLCFNPIVARLNPHSSLIVKASLSLKCTTEIDEDVLFCKVCLNTKGPRDEIDSNLRLKVQSEVSTLLDQKEISVGEKIGSGSCGSVHKGEWRSANVAIKKVIDPEQIASFRSELNTMEKVRSPHICMFYGVVEDPNIPWMVYEYLELGSLGEMIKRKIGLGDELCICIAMDCALGMLYLHKRNIIHRDLKPDNVLMVNMTPANVVCKITDFGISREISTLATTRSVVGTRNYIAPESFLKRQYSRKSDVFSYAMFLYVLATKKEPYSDSNRFRHPWDVPNFVMRGDRLEILDDCEPYFRDLICKCWCHIPDERPSFDKIVQDLTIVLPSIRLLKS